MKKSLAKWVTATTLAFTAVAATGTTGFAAKKEHKQESEMVTVVYQGEVLELEEAGARLFRENLILPVKAIAEANGGSVVYNEKSITATRGDISYTLRLHPRFFQFDNEDVLFAIIPSKIYSGKSINSLKFIERALGVTLEFNEEDNTLYIN
ncbi:hypothetical protein ABE41_017140 [Fictibacillus arsenicus]|uniref:Copper amine oxidase-like N-terminal domain-containing protein n=1 Tax=Fictibacillus arsenicus TaxID=255247 RepID=A0A1B1Z8E8_9BACL|nr:stalk domain-containing protein [Fictibacillus arsenicus]ANX13737.1 hypothetical protein ABE41_017140 [Fictibacillus arsenicus]